MPEKNYYEILDISRDARKEDTYCNLSDKIKKLTEERTKSPVYTWTTTEAQKPKTSSSFNIKFNFVTDFDIDHNMTNYDFSNKDVYKKVKKRKTF